MAFKKATEASSSCKVALVIRVPYIGLKQWKDEGYLYWGLRELRVLKPKIPKKGTLHEDITSTEGARVLSAEEFRERLRQDRGISPIAGRPKKSKVVAFPKPSRSAIQRPARTVLSQSLEEFPVLERKVFEAWIQE